MKEWYVKVNVLQTSISGNYQVSWLKITFLSLSDCSQCNYFGTLSCKEENGGMNCNCKPGYIGTKCESCESEDLIVSGTNGFCDDNGQGVKCSKF